jgi:hypothetical protein
MISLKEHRVGLINLKVTIDALDQLDSLIAYYMVDKPGPAYCTLEHVDGPGTVRVQLDRSIAVPALEAQRQRLVDYLKTLGIQA